MKESESIVISVHLSASNPHVASQDMYSHPVVSGESTTDVVFAGNGLIYENGSLLARSKRFCMEEQLIISEIDVERIRAERR